MYGCNTRLNTLFFLIFKVFERKFLETTCTLYEAEGRHLSQSLEVQNHIFLFFVYIKACKFLCCFAFGF